MSRRLLLTTTVISAALAACTVQRIQPAKSPYVPSMDEHMAHMSPADMQAPGPRIVLDVSATSREQGTPGLPASNNNAAARLKASPRHAEWVKFPSEPGSKDSIMAWVVYPVNRNKAPVVVVVHEIFGLSTWVRGVADQVAAEGFIAVAPDFLSRLRGGPTSDEMRSDSATAMIRGVNAAERNQVITAAANWAMMQPAAQQKYAVIGYCWGGSAVWGHAVNGGVMGYSGGVAFYGLPYTGGGSPATATTPAVPATVTADSLMKINKPVMLLSGTGDARITAAMPALDSMMKALKKNYGATNYEGAIHGFLRAQDDAIPPPTRAGATPREPAAIAAEQAANLAATKDGWPKTVAFLKKNLGVK